MMIDDDCGDGGLLTGGNMLVNQDGGGADDYGCKNGGDEAKTLSAKEATSGKIFLPKEQPH